MLSFVLFYSTGLDSSYLETLSSHQQITGNEVTDAIAPYLLHPLGGDRIFSLIHLFTR
ncbi:MAG: hypothetical protein AB1861_27200 [Cyanobacteriota bacterium]